MAKVNLLPENIRRGQDICCGCKYYVDKDDYSWEYICNFRAKNDGAKMKKISEYECTGFEPDEYANSHWEISGLNYIGISENRLHHILGVARKAYKIAKDMGKDEDFCRKCFMLGWIHDVGYEFSLVPEQHPANSAKMLLFLEDSCTIQNFNKKSYRAIKNHGLYTSDLTDEYKILNMADMLVNSNGIEVDVMTRLEEIKERYGEHSNQYLTACDICKRIGLTAVNIAGNIT